MGVSKLDLRAVVLEDGRTFLTHLLFDHVKQVLPDADEEDGELVGDPFEYGFAPSAEDIVIAIDSGDEEFLETHGMTHLLYEDSDPTHDRFICEENAFSNVTFLERTSIFDDIAPEDTFLVAIDQCCRHPEKCETHKRVHSKVVHGPDGERITKYSLVESHGVHGRKPRRKPRVTVRGAKVRAEIAYSPRGRPRCIGLVAEPRLLK